MVWSTCNYKNYHHVLLSRILYMVVEAGKGSMRACYFSVHSESLFRSVIAALWSIGIVHKYHCQTPSNLSGIPEHPPQLLLH
jgi:hypothetical protein